MHVQSHMFSDSYVVSLSRARSRSLHCPKFGVPFMLVIFHPRDPRPPLQPTPHFRLAAAPRLKFVGVSSVQRCLCQTLSHSSCSRCCTFALAFRVARRPTGQRRSASGCVREGDNRGVGGRDLVVEGSAGGQQQWPEHVAVAIKPCEMDFGEFSLK